MTLKPPSSSNTPVALTNVLNVQDYGARGNGSTDDTAAIQAAINAAEQQVLTPTATGGIVYMPPGVYVTSTPLTIKADNVSLIGSGKGYPTGAVIGSVNPVYGGTVIRPKASFAGSYTLAVGQSGTPTRALGGIRLADFSLDGSNLGATVSGGIHFQAQRSQIRDVIVARSTGTGIYVEAPTHVTTFPFGAYDNYFRDIIITQASQPPPNSGHGIQFSPGATDNVTEGLIVRGIAAGYYGIYLQGSGNQFHGGLLEICNDYAAYCAMSRNNKFVGVRFMDCAGGVYLTNGSAVEGGDWGIVGCSFRSCSRAADNTTDGIVVNPAYTMRGGVIAGCDFSSIGRNDPGYAMRYLINVASSNAIGVEIGPMSIGYVSPSTRAFGTASVHDVGTTTVRLDREPAARTSLRGQGLLAQNFERIAASAGSAMIAGTAYTMGLALQEGDVVTNVDVQLSAAGTGVSLFKASIVSSDGTTEYARTADESAQFATGGVKSLPLTASWTVPTTGVYNVIAVGTTATTMPSLWRASTLTSATKLGTSAFPYGTGGAGLTDLPTAPVSITVNNNPIGFWTGVS